MNILKTLTQLIYLQSFIKLLVCDECSEYFKEKFENKIIDKTCVIK